MATVHRDRRERIGRICPERTVDRRGATGWHAHGPVLQGSRTVLSAGASSANACAARTLPIRSSQRRVGEPGGRGATTALLAAHSGGNVEDEEHLSSIKARILASQKKNLSILLTRPCRDSVPALLTDPAAGSATAAASASATAAAAPTSNTPKASVTAFLSKATAADGKRSQLSAKMKVSQQNASAPLRPRPASSEQNPVKARRRAEIYAINAYLRSLEMKKFDDFKLEMSSYKNASNARSDCVDELSCISWSSSQSSLMPSPTYRSAKEKGATNRGKSGERKQKGRGGCGGPV